MIKRCFLTLVFGWLTIAVSSTASGQLGYTVETLYPQVGQAGTTVDVVVEGVFLDNLQEVIFYRDGIRCTEMKPVTDLTHLRNGGNRKVELGKAARLTLEIDHDAIPGEYQLRVRTQDNLSEMVTFWVTPFPVVNEQHPWEDEGDIKNPRRNDSAAHAQLIPQNCSVSGFLPNGPAQDDDWYAVDCRSGQRLSVEVVAARLGTYHYAGLNDPSVSIYDSAGKLLGRNDDNALYTQDPVVTVMVPRDGRYYVHMRQQMDYETSMRHYIMHVGDFPRPLVAYPLGGQAGTEMFFSLYGDASGPLIGMSSLPKKVGPFEAAIRGVFSVNSLSHFDSPSTARPPQPNRFRVTPFPGVLEQDEQSSLDAPQVIGQALPIAIDGKISSEGEVDWFRIHAQKGQRYRVFGYGKTLDSELDPRIWIRPAPENVSSKTWDEDDSRWEPHDLVGHHYRHQTKRRLDPVFMFEPDSDGDWLVGIADTRREYGNQHIYRIEFQPHVNSAFVYFPAFPSTPSIVRDRIVLFPGHSYTRPLGIQPGFGSMYREPLQLRASNLPDGVTIECESFRQDDGIIPLTFHATVEAKLDAALIDLVVEPVNPEHRKNFRGGFIQNNPSTNRRGDFAMKFNPTRRMALAVVEGATFDLELQAPSVPLVRNGELGLDVIVDRHGGFDGAVYCEMDWLPLGINKQPPLIIPAGETRGEYRLRAPGTAAIGSYPISITGRENQGGVVRTGAGFHYVSSIPITLNVGEPYVTVELVRSAIQRDTTGIIRGQISHHKAFRGDATLKLGRLPFGVEQLKPYPAIKAGDKEVEFRIKVSQECLVGQYRDIFCEATVIDGGQEITQQTGSGVLRVDP